MACLGQAPLSQRLAEDFLAASVQQEQEAQAVASSERNQQVLQVDHSEPRHRAAVSLATQTLVPGQPVQAHLASRQRHHSQEASSEVLLSQAAAASLVEVRQQAQQSQLVEDSSLHPSGAAPPRNSQAQELEASSETSQQPPLACSVLELLRRELHLSPPLVDSSVRQLNLKHQLLLLEASSVHHSSQLQVGSLALQANSQLRHQHSQQRCRTSTAPATKILMVCLVAFLIKKILSSPSTKRLKHSREKLNCLRRIRDI